MKYAQTIVAGLLSLIVGLGLGYVFWGSDAHRMDMSHRADWGVEQNGHRDQSMKEGMHMMPDGTMMSHGDMDHMNMTVKSEREFLEGMIPHHQEAVDTAKEVLARGATTPEIKQLVEAIVVAQEKEIAMMKEWYQSWYGSAYVETPEAYQPMMRDLSTLSGIELDRVFLEDMVMHHMGAVMMAQSVKAYIEHPEMAALTEAIIATQMEEIQLMEKLRQGL